MWYKFANQSELEFSFEYFPDYQASETTALYHGEPVGQMEFVHGDNGVVTTHAYLEPKFRGKGYGKAMYQFSWHKLKELGAEKVHSDHKVLTDARRVYETMKNNGWDITSPEDNPSIILWI